jgi:uncharacterized coiled-coil protein SlyX
MTDEIMGLRRQLADLQSENDGLRHQLSEPGNRLPWDLAKVARQRAALDRLHSAVVRQRFVLRTLEQLGRGLTREEFLAARAQVASEQARERIGEPAPA